MFVLSNLCLRLVQDLKSIWSLQLSVWLWRETEACASHGKTFDSNVAMGTSVLMQSVIYMRITLALKG